MNLGELIKVALEGIWVNKLRSALTMLGIIIGVAAVILVVTLGQAGQASIMAELESIGTNLFVVYIGQVDDGNYDKYKITSEDLRLIKESVEGIRTIVPLNYSSSQVQGKRKKESVQIIGTGADFFAQRSMKLVKGRFFSQTDDAVTRRVMVINQKMADDMFGTGGEAVGQKLTIGQVPVMVCGVCPNETGMFAGQASAQAWIPMNLYFDIYDTRDIWQIEGNAVSKDKVEEASKQVVRILKSRHGVQDDKIYVSYTMEQEMKMANKVMGIITSIIGAIAGISLVVGGIGIMNIMLVSVTERTREIGIRMAVGARRKDILIQFLVEAMVLSLLGGIIGTLIGIGGSSIVSLAVKMKVIVSPTTIILACLFSMVVGVFFGLYPANKAAKLDPIESLRYE
ncbi:MAG: ABC transporter permease [Chitinophagales bacterium]